MFDMLGAAHFRDVETDCVLVLIKTKAHRRENYCSLLCFYFSTLCATCLLFCSLVIDSFLIINAKYSRINFNEIKFHEIRRGLNHTLCKDVQFNRFLI